MLKIKCLLLVLLAIVSMAPNAQSQDKSTSSQKFDYGWKFKLGDYPEAAKPDFNDSLWRRLDLPHDWSIEGNFDAKNPMGNDGGYLPAGIGWYRKTFEVKADVQYKKMSLYFEGIYMNAEVFINGTSLGIRPYGYSSFYYDISPYIKKGQNIVAVKVDNSQQKNCRWYSGSGIYRHVWLTTTNPVHIQQWGVNISTPEANSKKATVNLKVNVQNQSIIAQNIILAVNIYDKRNKRVGNGEVSATLNANSVKEVTRDIILKSPFLWSPHHPDRYRAEIKIIQKNTVPETYTTRFGIRKIEYSAEKGFVLNNTPIKLNGGCVHHDNGPLGAAAYDRAEYKKAELLKGAGFNAVRTSHNPPSEAFLDACDSLGLLVIDETFDGWRERKNTYDYSLYFDKWWKKDTEAMVLRDRNHPSIVIWSIGNEIIERKTLEAVQTAHKLVTQVHKLDPSRPVTSAMASWDKNWEIFDPLFAMHDIGGYNYLMQHAEADHERVPSRIILQTESYPRDAFSNWKAVNDHAYVVGDFVWTAIDYLGESGIGRNYYTGDLPGEHWERDLFPWHGAYCGDIDLTGWRKPISHYREILYSERQNLYMAVKEPNKYYGEIHETLWSVWPTWESWNWPGHEGKNIDVEIYSKYPLVRLYHNGKLIGEKATTRNEEFKAVFTIPYEPGELKAVAVVNNKEVNPVILKTAGEASQIKLSADRTVLKPDGQDLCYISVELMDGQGNLQPNAEDQLTFSIKGSGTITAVANANLKDISPYIGHQKNAWKGRAMVVVKSSSQGGNIELSVTGAGLKPGKVNLTSK